MSSKAIRVIITGDAKEEFGKLNSIVGEEIAKGITNSSHQVLFNSIRQKIELLKENPQYGIHVPKNLIPNKYVNLYDVNNLWKINLSGAWRMIYTIKGNEIEIISLILDIFDHKIYEKTFSYKKS